MPQEMGERMENVPPHLAKLFDEASHPLNREQRVRLAGILCPYKDTFVKSGPQRSWASQISDNTLSTPANTTQLKRY